MQHPLWLGYEMWLNMTVIKLSTKDFFSFFSSHAPIHTITQTSGLYSVTHIQTHLMETTSAQLTSCLQSSCKESCFCFQLPEPCQSLMFKSNCEFVWVWVGVFFKEVRDIAHMACWPGTSIYYKREVKLTVIKAVWKYGPETSQLLRLHRVESVCVWFIEDK